MRGKERTMTKSGKTPKRGTDVRDLEKVSDQKVAQVRGGSLNTYVAKVTGE